MLKDFIKVKIESDQIYKINKNLIHHLLKRNTNLDMR